LGQFVLAANGPNAAQLWAGAWPWVMAIALPAAIVGGVALYQMARWCSSPRAYWQLVLQPDLWQLQGLFGLRTYGRVVPELVHDVIVSEDGQVMADLLGESWEPLSGPQAPSDAAWLRDALSHCLRETKPLTGAGQASRTAARPDPGSAKGSVPPQRVDWPAPPAATGHETVPPSYVRNEPGTHFRFSLLPQRAERKPGVTCLILFAIAFLSMPLMGLVTLLVQLVADPIRAPWLGAVGMLGLIAVGLIVVMRRRRFHLLYGPRLEIEQHPLSAGAACRAHLAQRGPLKIVAARVLLVCQERVSFTDGTVTRWAQEQVYEAEQWRADDLELTRDRPLDQEFTVAMPAGAMHSFQSAHNSISWKLRVEEQILGRWRPWRHEFPIILRATTEAGA
jgi:hypothetical protein